MIQGDLWRWAGLPILWLGRIVSIKINGLSHLFYAFHTLPIYVPLATLKQTQKELLFFVWDSKERQVWVSTLYALCYKGSLVMPQSLNIIRLPDYPSSCRFT